MIASLRRVEQEVQDKFERRERELTQATESKLNAREKACACSFACAVTNIVGRNQSGAVGGLGEEAGGA